MSTWDEFFADYCKKNWNELMDSANHYYKIYKKYVYSQFYDEEEANAFCWRTIFMIMTADHELSTDEYEFYKEFWTANTTSDKLCDRLNAIDIEHYKREIQKLPHEPKNALLNIATAIACCDGWLMGSEKTFLKEMWDY